jgi:hypothetical protein
VKRLVVCTPLLAVLAALGACGGSSATLGPGAMQGGSTSGAPGGATPGAGGTAQTGGGLPSYTVGAATATVVVAGTSYPIAAGTCAQTKNDVSGVATYTFDLVAGAAQKPGWLEIHITDLSNSIRDGQYHTGLSTVTVQVAADLLLVGSPTINVKDGTTAGDFSGTSAGSNPQAGDRHLQVLMGRVT